MLYNVELVDKAGKKWRTTCSITVERVFPDLFDDQFEILDPPDEVARRLIIEGVTKAGGRVLKIRTAEAVT